MNFHFAVKWFSFHVLSCLYLYLSLSHLISGRPFALQNCSVSNQSSDSLQVECEPGFDGGLPQQFLLELVEMPALRLAKNLSLQVSTELSCGFSLPHKLCV